MSKQKKIESEVESKPVQAEKKQRRVSPYKGEYEVCVETFLNVRSGAGKDFESIAKLDNGIVVECKGGSKKDAQGNVWLAINGGYCMLDFLKKL